MSRGQMVCAGTAAFLKAKYGVGYSLDITRQSTGTVQHIVDVVQKHIPEAVVDKNIGTHVLVTGSVISPRSDI